MGAYVIGSEEENLFLRMVTQERIAFVDAKGTRNVGLHDPKIGFFKTIKEIEARLSNPDVVLESFLVSNTPSHELSSLWDIRKEEMLQRHSLFQEEDKDTYISALLQLSQ